MLVTYDSINDNELLFFEDIERGSVKVCVVETSDKKLNDTYSEIVHEDVKFAMGDKFQEDMILTVTDSEFDNWKSKNKQAGIEYILGTPVNISTVSAETIYDDFRLQEIYRKFLSGVFTKEQMFCAMIDRLSGMVNEEKKRNFDYFMKYEYRGILEEGFKRLQNDEFFKNFWGDKFEQEE